MVLLEHIRRSASAGLPGRMTLWICTAAAVTTIMMMVEYRFRACIEVVGNPSQLTSVRTIFWLRMLFGRSRSRWFGTLADITLPVWIGVPLFRLFAWKYGVDLDEVQCPLESFQTFNDFFCRTLKAGARPISHLPTGLVSPVDGRLTTYGIVPGRGARIDQIKGATYSVPAFLGVDPVEDAAIAGCADEVVVHYAVLYLAPGNYHRIHSPAHVTFEAGRHFAGEFFPLKEALLRSVSDIFAVNERVVLSGNWQYGKFHLVAVAAANVGNIFLDFDPKLQTNQPRDAVVHCGGDVASKFYPSAVAMAPGDAVGGFRLGSTVVLFFEAPRSFRWRVALGESVLVGAPLGEVVADVGGTT